MEPWGCAIALKSFEKSTVIVYGIFSPTLLPVSYSKHNIVKNTNLLNILNCS